MQFAGERGRHAEPTEDKINDTVKSRTRYIAMHTQHN